MNDQTTTTEPITGTYNALIYSVRQGEKLLHRGGNNPMESTTVVAEADGVGLDQMRAYCEVTAREHAERLGVTVGSIKENSARLLQVKLKTSIIWADQDAAERASTHLLGMNKPGQKPLLLREKTEHGFRITCPMVTKAAEIKPCTVFEFHHISNQPLGRRIDFDPRVISIQEPTPAQ